MNRPVTTIKSVGAVRATSLEEAGLTTIRDLLYYFPRRYIDRTIKEHRLLSIGETHTLFVQIISSYLAHGRKSRLIVQTRTSNGEAISLIFFKGIKYFQSQFVQGYSVVVSGKLDFYNGMQMIHPDYELLDPDDEHALLHVGRIVPLYRTTEQLRKRGFDSRGFRKLVQNALSVEGLTFPELVPGTLIKKRNLMNRKNALKQIHFPDSFDERERALIYLKYEEIYLFHALMKRKRELRCNLKRKESPMLWNRSREFANFISKLPFKLTRSQELSIQKIVGSCQSPHPESFLLQGDVGSGKSVVALGIALHYIEKNLQCALMVPTEVLARQHFQTFSNLIGMRSDLRVALLTGSDRAKDKEMTLDELKRGEISILIGTHAMIEESVTFKNLAFAIIDEQHRFGVEQREKLRKKGEHPDILSMTATPIPRTLSLIQFADLNLVTLNEKPADRPEIKTLRVNEDQRNKVYRSIRKYISEGRQAFIVYPLIEESEKSDLKAASVAFETLSKSIFPDLRVELLHGRMKTKDKDGVMKKFRDGKIDILVSTTVIEVGIDVPNATMMIIEHPERFGISQLHQLRGRVGRGSHESFCILMSQDQNNEETPERLDALVKSNDGFYLSEVDMKIRGPGEILGLRQHGLPDFKLTSVVDDAKLIGQAAEDSLLSIPLSDDAVQFIRRSFQDGVLIFPD